MPEDRKRGSSKHCVSIDEREKIMVTGVIDVLSFDEESIIMDTEQGMLILRGEHLHVGKLNLDEGEVCIDGMIESLEYSEGGQFTKAKGSLMARIFK